MLGDTRVEVSGASHQKIGGCVSELGLPAWPLANQDGDGGRTMVIGNASKLSLKAHAAYKKQACDLFARYA